MLSGNYFHLSITAIVISVLLSCVQFDGSIIKPAQAHSITVPVRGILPIGIAYNPVNNNMYVANAASATVSVISGSTDSIIGSILVGNLPISIAYAPPNKLYVTNAGSDDVYVINGATNRVIRDIPVGEYPWGITYNPANADVYVVNNQGNTVSVIDTSTDAVVDNIQLGNVLPPPSLPDPQYITYHRTNGGVYVGGNQQISVLNAASNVDLGDLQTPSTASNIVGQLAHNPNNNRIYAAVPNSNTVVILNPDTHRFEGSPIPVGTTPYAIVYHPNNNRIYVTNLGSNSVSIINPITNTEVGTIPVGDSPAGIAINPSNNHIYVTNFGSNTVSIIHP